MARLLTVKELERYITSDYLLWAEYRDHKIVPKCMDNPVQNIYCYLDSKSGCIVFSAVWEEANEYGITWRCWEGKPTEEQLKNTPWEP